MIFMNPVVLRHRLQESVGKSAFVVLFHFSVFGSITYFGTGFERLSLYHLALLMLPFGLIEFIMRNRQFVRIDEDGLTVRYALYTRSVHWNQVHELLAPWSPDFDGSYSVTSWESPLTFKGDNNQTLLQLKLDFGPLPVRYAIKNQLEQLLSDRINTTTATITPQ